MQVKFDKKKREFNNNNNKAKISKTRMGHKGRGAHVIPFENFLDH